jgi:hypothetical protein
MLIDWEGERHLKIRFPFFHMRYIEAPAVYNGNEKSLFLGGGITGCPDWQDELVNSLRDEEIVLLNPRRKNFPIDNPNAAREQILWEHRNLRKSSANLFWFPKESLCPIALYELGTWSMTDKTLFVGVHPEYKRKIDVEIQTELVRPDIKIEYDLKSLSKQVINWIRKV